MSTRHRLEAYGALWRRYTTIFAFYWKQRQGLTGRILNESEAEFLPSALALQNKPVSPAARILSRTLIGIVVVLIAWACLGKMDIVVNATGKIIPSGYTKTIASIDVASVRALYVDEGQKVRAGDVLIELDATASDAERDKASGDGGTALLQAARAQALINAIDTGKPPQLALVEGVSQEKWQTAQLHLDGQFRDYSAKLKRIDGDIARYAAALPLATQRSNDYKVLLAEHDVSRHAWMEKEQARIEIFGQLTDAKNQRRALTEEMRRTAYDQMTEGRKLAAAYQQDVLRSDARSKLLKITSPVDGTVQQLDVHTVGGIVAAAKPLMQIVPSDSKVVVEAFLENKDVGFVRKDHQVEVKVDAFEYTKYGTVSGKVVQVSSDAIPDEKRGLIYSVSIELNKSSIEVEGKHVPLSAGMSVNVEIKTGDRRIIAYVLSPLMQHKRESLNER